MKRLKSITMKFIIMTLVLTMSVPMVANAQGKGAGANRDKGFRNEKQIASTVTGRDTCLEEKDALEAEKDTLEAEKDTMEEALAAAEAGGDEEAVAELSESISIKKREMEQIKIRMKEKILEAKMSVRASYTDEELAAIDEMRESLALRFKNVRILPVESIVARGRNMKFDTPPVIRDGRTLIPVRAVSEAFGAEVSWNQEDRTVTVIKGETEIVLEIGSLTAMVNGDETVLDAPSEIMGGRTVIPLRFVIEKLGLTVEWDEETETVEIGDEAATEADEAGSDEEPVEQLPVGEEAGTEEAGTEEAGTEEAGTEEAGTEEAPAEQLPVDESALGDEIL